MNLNRIVNVGRFPISVNHALPGQLYVRGLAKSKLICSEIRFGVGLPARVPEFPKHDQDTYCVGVAFKNQQSDIVVDGKTSSVARRAGQTQLLYLPAIKFIDFSIPRPRHGIEILLTRSFLHEIAEDLEVPEVTHIGRSFRELADDPVFKNLALRIHPFFDSPDSLDPLYADHLMWALGIHASAHYGNLVSRRPKAGALSTWQERLAKDVIEVSLVGGIGLAELANFCGLRTSQFAHAFKVSTGVAPYQWLAKRRIAQAKRMLVGTTSLVEIADASGFADQSHMTRIFSREVGTTPGKWRANLN